MSIVSEVNRLKDAKTSIKTAIEGKGVTVPDATMLEGMAALIDAIEMYKAKTLRTLQGEEKEAMEKAVDKTVEALKAETNE